MGELMNHGASSEYCPVVDVGLTCYAHIADENAVVSDTAIVGYVHIGHNESVIADLGHALAAGLCSTVDGCALAYVHAVANLNIGNLSVKLEVLRHGSDDSSGEHVAILSHPGVRQYGGVRIDMASVTYFNIVVDICIWSNFDVISELRTRMHCCKWMNLVHN